MHILHITREWDSDTRYGIGKSLASLNEALRARGHVVEVFNGDTSTTVPPGRLAAWIGRLALFFVRRYFVPSGAGKAESEMILGMLVERVSIVWAATQWAARNKVTHVHCHDPVLAYLYARFAFFFGATRRWGVTEHAFGAFIQDRPGVRIPATLLKRLQAWEREVARSAAWLCVPSYRGLQQLALDLGLQTFQDTKLSLPVNWHAVHHPKPVLQRYDRALARQMLGIAEYEWVVLGVGQLVPMKRFPLLIEACGLIEPALRPLLIILGEGDQSVLLEAAKQAGMEAQLRIEVTDDIGLYFSAVDVYASSTATESFGMANCEALSAGLPAVCTAVGAVPEIIEGGAWLVGEFAEEMAVALTALRKDPELCRHYAGKAVAWAATWSEPGQVAEKMERIYADAS